MTDIKGGLKNFVRTRGVGYYLTIPAIVAAIVSIALYQANGKNIYSPDYNTTVFVCLGVGIALAVISLFTDLVPYKWTGDVAKIVRTVAYLIFLYAVLQYVYTQIAFLGAVFVAIDVEQYEPLIPDFMSTIVTMGVTAVIALVAALLDSWRPWARGEAKEV